MNSEDFASRVYSLAPLPVPVDPFAVHDAEARFVSRFIQAGSTEDQARVQVRAVLRQLALAWGLHLPPGAPVEGPPPSLDPLPAEDRVGVLFQDGLEIRRRYFAKPLDQYGFGDQVCVRDEDSRWVRASAGSYDHARGVLWAHRPIDQPALEISDPIRVQPFPG